MAIRKMTFLVLSHPILSYLSGLKYCDKVQMVGRVEKWGSGKSEYYTPKEKKNRTGVLPNGIARPTGSG